MVHAQLRREPSPLTLTRRALLRGAAGGVLMGSLPRAARAQTRSVRIGALHPASGPFADIGIACRLGVQLAVDMVNASGGIPGLDGARLELVVGDSALAAAAEAERLYNVGARIVTGAFHSGHTAAAAAVARRRGLPFLIDTAIADATVLPALTGERVVVFRNFPTTTMFARQALQSIGEMFADAQRPIGRVTLLHSTDALGTTQAHRVEAAYLAERPSFELREFLPVSPRATSFSGEVTKLRALVPDVLLLAVRPTLVAPLFTQLRRAPLSTTILSLGTPDLFDAARAGGVVSAVERVMELAPSPNVRSPRTQRLVEEFGKRSGGKRFEATTGYAYEAMLVVADALDRARSPEAGPLADALKQTNLPNPLMVAAGPIVFDANGENPNATPAVLQILGGKPSVVWPRSAAERGFVLGAPRP